MSTAGEAASLFGSPDPAHDPFATALGGDTTLTGHSAGADLFSAQEPSAAADLFSGNGETNLFDAGPASSDDLGQYTDSSTNYGDQYHTYGNQSTPNGQYAHQAYASGQTQTQYSRWDGYPQQQDASAVYGTYGGSSHTANTYTHDAYAPYASNPQTSHGNIAPSQQYSSYDPYAPVVSNTHTVEQSSASTYDSYKPVVNAPAQQPSAPDYNQVRSPPAYSIPPLAPPISGFNSDVPPPLPSASAYRPKTSNAYDPPLPPPKPSKRVHNWQAQSPPVATTNLYGGSGSRILSPPPPRGPSVNRQIGSLIAPPPSMSPVHVNQYAAPSQPQYHGNAVTQNYTAPPLPVPNPGYYAPSGPSTQPPSGYAPDVYQPPVLEHVDPYANISSENGRAVHGNDASFYDRASSPRTLSNWNDPHDIHAVSSETAPYGVGQDNHVNHTVYSGYEDHHPDPEGAEFHKRTTSPVSVNGIRSKHTSPAPFDLSSSPPKTPPKRLSRHQSPERGKSPSSSIRSATSAHGRQTIDQPVKRYSGSTSPVRPASYEPSSNGYASPNMQAYVPPPITSTRRTASPASFTPVSPLIGRDIPTADTYVPLDGIAGSSTIRDRSMSASSSFSSTSAPPVDPYAPSAHSRQQSTESYKYTPPSQPSHVHIANNAFAPPPANTHAYDRFGGQVLSVAARATQAAYAPSPSLLGSNDPLGRTSVKVPVVSFGFGGKLVTCFHGVSTLNTGFDVALTSRQSTDVQVRVLSKVIPQSALDTSTASYPGPLFSDPGTPATSLVRTGAAAQTKTKKVRVAKYLEERAEEISRGLGYLHQGSLEGRRAEAKHTLLLLLKIMVENDGKLSGSAEIDSAVRRALVPSITSQDSSTEGMASAASIMGGGLSAVSSTSYSSTGSSLHDIPINVHTLRAAHLDKIQNLLTRGERRLAFQYAADEKLWAHAMVIASSIDKDAWRDVVKEFVQTELATKGTGNTLTSRADGNLPSSNGREPLRVAYSLFAGQGAASVQELAPQKLLIDNASSLQVPTLPNASVTPLSPNFPQSVPAATIPQEVLSKWAETAAMIISNPMTTEASSALTALGDQLAAGDWIEAAHVCYLLSPQTSPVGGIGNPAARVLLFGAANPKTTPSFWKDPDPIIFSEIVEFALSLKAPTKGQEAFSGLPHLQAYRLLRATCLAEIGHVQEAHRYCEAISNCLSRSSPYIHGALVAELKGLTDRLIAAPQVDKSGSWIGSKMNGPSFDKLGNWLGRGLTSFIAGDGESHTPEDIREQDHSFTGPFAHYSQISSATTSAIPTPQRSATDLTEVPSAHTPHRSGSAMALRPPMASHVQINRASSAMDYIRRKASPVPRVSSANAATASFADAPAPNGYGHLSNATPRAYQAFSSSRLSEISAETEGDISSDSPSPGPQIASWWGADSEDSGAPTPTVSSFARTETSVTESTDGFISMMDNDAFSVTPTPSTRPSSSNHSYGNDDFDDDELGLGNASNRPQQVERTGSSSSSSTSETKPSEAVKTPENTAPEAKQTASSGWLSRLWRKNDTPAPVKANLGEQTSFYYDKEQKRWVNKNSSGETEKPAATPPPPRAQTASPGTATARLPNGPPIARTPPVRPSTAIDLTDSPPRQPMRARSNLVPSDVASAPSSPATAKPPLSMDGPPGLDGPPPPGARARAQAKRNIRTRYVDVFQQS